MATSLQLVNRVRRKLRWGDTAAFTSDEDKSILDEVNAAVAVIFESHDWECDIRHDGVQMTYPDVTRTLSNVTNGLLLVSRAGLGFYDEAVTAAAVRAVLRAIVPDDAGYPDTAYYVESGGVFAVANSALRLTALYPGTTQALAADVRLVANEFVLPSTVRKVTSVRHQESDITLCEWGDAHGYERHIQRPHDTVSDHPERVVIVGQGTATFVATMDATGALNPTTQAGSVGPTMLVWPTPMTQLVLNYSYLLKRAEMTETTDTLANADRALEDFVVELAFGRCVGSFVGDANPEMGLAIETRVMHLVRAYSGNQGKDPSRRRIIGSNFAERQSGVPFGRFPRNFGTGT